MRTVAHDPDDEDLERVDWKDSPMVVLEAVDRLLAPRGLEVVLTDSQSDTYHFKIDQRSS